MRHQSQDATPQALAHLPTDERNSASCPQASVFHDSFETGALEASPGGFGILLIGVGANLNAVVLVSPRRENERGKFLLLQARGEFQRIRFPANRSHLQSVRASGHERSIDGFS